jgi:hypothetical protein
VNTPHASHVSLRNARGKILVEKFLRSLDKYFSNGKNKFIFFAMEISARRSPRHIFSGFLRESHYPHGKSAGSSPAAI